MGGQHPNNPIGGNKCGNTMEELTGLPKRYVTVLDTSELGSKKWAGVFKRRVATRFPKRANNLNQDMRHRAA